MTPEQERLRQKVEGVLLDAQAEGVEWSTELETTAETLVEIVDEWLAEEASRADALRSYHRKPKWNTELDGPAPPEPMTMFDKDHL